MSAIDRLLLELRTTPFLSTANWRDYLPLRDLGLALITIDSGVREFGISTRTVRLSSAGAKRAEQLERTPEVWRPTATEHAQRGGGCPCWACATRRRVGQRRAGGA